ncbi:MAG: FKBP-type peptidyl-prolyl cis-trans isomerase [Firmicutes bacterium]|nr:FKBP-type peptidyl-prolyl cis-trans isomerase [Bacillota bacterium]MCM1400655.1 FKBP-type peptidyl-prolyl cis-trans isomerase [Bacteroides sp.]MCM1476346.1 FKBP-type peptidyl-prolyl cis-trans isomerase [Bacteroides sp.]
MKKLFQSLAIATFAAIGFWSCGDDDTWSEYEEWRETNTEWYNTQLSRKNVDGTPYFTVIQPDWYPQSGVLIHYFNDRELTKNNLQPMLTSHVTVKYHGRLYNDVCFDSTSVGADSVRTFALTNTITGWQIALTQMHVGDSCEIIIPYSQGYGYAGSTSATGVQTISPYSTLRFNIGLKEVPAYEIP